MRKACKENDPELAKKGWRAFECFGGKVCLILKDENGIRGFVNVCPHAGGTSVPVEEERMGSVLKCQSHGALFNIISGKALTPPAPEGSGLRTLGLKVEDGVIYYQ
ncbi:MAG: Rieske 2Fe-2S domain-containing protein [Candidatus Sungbacteria bacterium]|nr:Rieske 2Fe-2S domain-containing protein [Candidatus Sungbacteria bacterium]